MPRKPPPEIHSFAVHAIGDGGDSGKATGWAAFPELDPWTLRFEARLVEGRLVLTQLAIEFDPTDSLRAGTTPRYPARGIGSDLIASVRVGALLEAIHARLIETKDGLRDLVTEDASDDDHRLYSDALSITERVGEAKPHKRGNPGFTDTYLRHVAEVRLAVQDEGLRPINAAVADRLGLPSPERARDHVNAATGRIDPETGEVTNGWLLPGTEGRSARLPGPKLIAARAADGVRRPVDSITEEGSTDDNS